MPSLARSPAAVYAAPVTLRRLNPFASIPRGREVWAWGMYDLANQSFQLLIDTLLLVLYFKNVVAPSPQKGEAWWGPIVGAAMLLVVIFSPLLGALADARAWKKALLIGTGLAAVPLMAALAFMGPGMVWQTAAIYIAAKLLVGLGENFLGSFLPELSTPQTVGKISALGWTMSYIGALLLLGIAAIVVWGFGADQPNQWRWMFVLASAWFLGGMIPAMLLLRERTPAIAVARARLSARGIVSDALRRLLGTVREARQHRQFVRFLGVFFVYSLGTNTVIFFLGSIGDSFGFKIGELILMALVMLGLAWYLLHIWNREIVLFERGFSYREGSQTVFFRYVEIDALRLQAERRAYFGGLIRRTIYRYTLRTTQDETFTITNLYHRVAELGERLTERVNLVLIPRLAAKLENGDSIPFSANLTISAKGLRVDGRDLAWDQFAGWEVKARALHLKQADGSVWASIPLAEIDNITALLNLLRARVQTGVEHND